MKVKVKLYSILRDSTGLGEVEIPLFEGSRVSDLVKELLKFEGFKRAYEVVGGSIVVLDEEGSRLNDDDIIEARVVHVMPQPAGGSKAYIEVGVLEGSSEVDLRILESRLSSTRPYGATAFFIGRVKEFNEGERVLGLYYEYAGDVLEKVLKRIALEEALKWGLGGVAVYHYVGWRRVGDVTIIVGVSGDSRKRVFPALEEVVERVKREAPIWKVEYRDSGRYYILGDRIIGVDLLKPLKLQPSQPSF